jgi:hypothetical protein
VFGASAANLVDTRPAGTSPRGNREADMTTTVITTIEQGSEQTLVGGSLLVTGTGGIIDPSGDALAIESTARSPVGTVTIEAGALVFGDGNGIDFTGFDSAAQFLIDGTVQGNGIGMNLTDAQSDTGGVTITIGSTGSVDGGGAEGILADTSSTVIVNHGLISGPEIAIAAGGGNTSTTITNTGTIDGMLQLEQDGTSVVIDTGTIDSSYYYGIYAVGGTSATLTIDGDVTGSSAGIYAAGTSTSLVEGPQGLITGNDGVVLASLTTATVDGSIVGSQDGVDMTVPGSTITIGETGSLSGGNGAGINVSGNNDHIENAGIIKGVVGVEANYDDTSFVIQLTNTGTILGGVVFADSYDDSISNAGGKIGGGVSLGLNDTLDNANGTIGGGVIMVAGDTLTNSGTIGGGIQGAGGETIYNSGTIAGGYLELGTTSDTIDNMGRFIGYFSGGAAYLENSGTMQGVVYFADQSTLVNSGTITGEVQFGASGNNFTNTGTIHGEVALGAGDSFTNDGTTHGFVVTGTGDQLDMGTGTVSSDIGAAASDVFLFNGSFGEYQISGFEGYVGHKTTFDVIDFASDDFTSYTELQSHMAQVGADVVITLDATDDIVLLGTKLSTLSTHDFLFS